MNNRIRNMVTAIPKGCRLPPDGHPPCPGRPPDCPDRHRARHPGGLGSGASGPAPARPPGPLPLAMAPQTATLLWAKLLARDGDFFLGLGKALKRGVADRRERRAVDKLEEFLLLGASLWTKGPWSDADLLSLFQRKGIVTERMDPAGFKGRRQRLGVPLRPKGRRRLSPSKDSGSIHLKRRKGS